MRKLLNVLVILAGGIAFVAMAQQPPGNSVNRYVVSKSTKAVTIQQPATNASQVQFETAAVYCATATTVTVGFNGGAATGTALTIVKVPPTLTAPRVTAWYDSNVSSPTSGAVYNLNDTSSLMIDLSPYSMGTGGTGTNFTLTAGSACTINIFWREQ